ncbi:MAG: GreA/GreB family elongation factor [Alphaproteobacteria bacterium]|nr:GreA/GreB family elongation factor [Alphaproteobacteria bacterium]
MSRAFVREDDVGQDSLPPARARSANPNYITRAGLDRLRERYEKALAQRKKMGDAAGDDAPRRADRDLAWLRDGIASAVVVGPEAASERVGFGATVTIEDEDGQRRTLTLVGEDEADPGARRYNWASPLGRALLGAAVGDAVSWRAPGGEREVVVIGLSYEALT